MSIEKHFFISSGFDEVCVKFLDKLSNFHYFFIDDLIIEGLNFDLLNLSNLNVNYNHAYDEVFFSTFCLSY